MNLTDNEIKKALEHEIYLAKNVGDYTVYTVELSVLTNALDLINRLQAKLDEAEDTIQFADKELKKANAENERLKGDIEIIIKNYVEAGKIIKTEAVKSLRRG